jgi:hypothetical protein
VRIGQQVRIIELRGCMAHTRFYGNVKRARITNVGSVLTPAGDERYDAIELEDMTTGSRFWRPRLGWVTRHGILEYQV